MTFKCKRVLITVGDRLQHLSGCFRNFWTDAVARQQNDMFLHIHPPFVILALFGSLRDVYADTAYG